MALSTSNIRLETVETVGVLTRRRENIDERIYNLPMRSVFLPQGRLVSQKNAAAIAAAVTFSGIYTRISG